MHDGSAAQICDIVGAVDDRSEVLRVSGSLAIPVSELTWKFSASGGPGGQHANTSNTKVECRFDIESSPSLSDVQRDRLLAKVGPQAIVVVSDERSQARNRAIAVERMTHMLSAALKVRARRVPTRPGKGAQKRRVEAKQRRGQIKRLRGPINPAGD